MKRLYTLQTDNINKFLFERLKKKMAQKRRYELHAASKISDIQCR